MLTKGSHQRLSDSRFLYASWLLRSYKFGEEIDRNTIPFKKKQYSITSNLFKRSRLLKCFIDITRTGKLLKMWAWPFFMCNFAYFKYPEQWFQAADLILVRHPLTVSDNRCISKRDLHISMASSYINCCFWHPLLSDIERQEEGERQRTHGCRSEGGI